MTNNTLHQIKKYISDKKLFLTTDKILIGVSGGMDSMVLLAVLHHLKYTIEVAHVNFQLRGEESDADEALVVNTCKKLGIKFHVKKIDTATYAQENKGSIQMIARELRYDWFEKLCKEEKCKYVAIAHHANDQSETILQHLTKGSGIAGLRGMLPKNNTIVRPFLCIDKSNIEYLAGILDVSYREDSSNASDKYERNKIRHHVVPTLQEINPKFHHAVFNTSNYLAGVEQIYQSYIQRRLKKIVVRDGEYSYKAPSKSFANDTHGINLLYEWLSPYGFNSEQLTTIYSHVRNDASGKEFIAEKYRLVVDRKYIYVHLQEGSKNTFLQIETIPFTCDVGNKKITISYSDAAPTTFDKNNKDIMIDASNIKLPLTIRNWNEGDYMYPLGMKMKKKKVSDIFINKKIPKHKKSELLFFFSADNLFFVEGIGIDERYKIKEDTKTFLRVELK
jgi:tRNA(Ile)-lysidine synthase